MKVLFLTHDGLTDPLGQSQVLPYLCGLADYGHSISVLSLEKQSAFNENSSKIRQICDGAGINWHHLPFPENSGRLEQLKTTRRFNRKALAVSRENNVKLLHCRSYPAAMTGRYVRRKTGIPMIFDMRGFWIDERREGNIWNFSNPLTCLLVLWLRRVEKKLLKKSDAIVSLTHKGREIINTRYPQNSSGRPIAVIPCCADYKHFHPQPAEKRNALRAAMQLPSSAYILIYLGSLGTWYLLEEMLDFFSELMVRKPDARFLFLSKENPEKILTAAKKKGISEGSLIIRAASREQVPDYVAVADCSISFIRPSWSKQGSSPVKWAETLACGIPMVVNNGIGDISVLKASLKGVFVTCDFSKPAYIKVIDEILESETMSGPDISETSRTIFDLSRGIEAYHNLYEKTVAKKILFIASHRPGRAPNQRFRFEQYFPYFEHNGFQCTLSYLIDKEDDAFIYKPGHFVRKAWFFFGKCIIRRLRILLEINRYDLIYISREALMTRSLFFEKRFGRSKASLIFDFDDSIWLTNVSSANRSFHWLKNPGKTAAIIGMSSHVIAGNQYLADYARQWNDKITIIPTALDTDVYHPIAVSKEKSPVITIGWTGSITTIPHFEFIIPVLIKIKDKYREKVRFEVIGDPDYYYAGLDIIGKAWSLEDEKEMMSTFDIGIMPLPDDEWTRGKCGFKGLLCMSMGIPVIMSKVGVNTEIIEDGINGFLADGEEEWFQKLSLLIESEEKRSSLAVAGRQTVVEKYSVNSWKDTYVDIFKKLTGDGVER